MKFIMDLIEQINLNTIQILIQLLLLLFDLFDIFSKLPEIQYEILTEICVRHSLVALQQLLGILGSLLLDFF